jgi:hypothetical protein
VPTATAHIPPELLDGVEGAGLLERGSPRGAGLGLRLDVEPEGPLPVQLVRPLRLRRAGALSRRSHLWSRRRSRGRHLNLRHVERAARPPPPSEGFLWVVEMEIGSSSVYEAECLDWAPRPVFMPDMGCKIFGSLIFTLIHCNFRSRGVCLYHFCHFLISL